MDGWRITTKMHPILHKQPCAFYVFLVPFRDPQDRVYNKTLEYVKTFAKFNTTDSASVVSE